MVKLLKDVIVKPFTLIINQSTADDAMKWSRVIPSRKMIQKI